jgi:hypothetical protein
LPQVSYGMTIVCSIMVDMPALGYRKYTPEQLAELSRLYEQMPLKDAAERMGMTYQAAFYQVRQLGLLKPFSQIITMQPVTQTPEQLAYTAGLIDGEGTVSIRTMHGKHNPKPHVRIANSSVPLMDWLRATYSGPSIFIERRKPKHTRVAHYMFHIGGFGYLPLYEALLPYLVIKGPQMNCLVEYIKERMSQTRLEPLSPRCREMVDTVRRLNIKPSNRSLAGPSETSPSTT